MSTAASWAFLAILFPAQGLEQVEDFEAPRVLEGIYDGWERVRSEAHPPYNGISLAHDQARARSGSRWIRLTTLGGRTALRMLPGHAWKIDPLLSYRLTAWTRLSGTKSNVAFLSVTWLDGDGAALREDRSPPVTQAPEWTEAAIDIPAPPPAAARAAVGLRFEGRDVRGEAHFDQVRLVGEPRVILHPRDPRRALLIFEPDETPRLQATVPRLTAGPCALEVTTRGAAGEVVARVTGVSIQAGSPGTVSLPPHPPGAYELEVALSGTTTKRRSTLLVPGPPLFPTSREAPFGASLNTFTTRYAGAAELARLAGIRHARVAVWDRPSGGRSEAPAPDEIAELLRAVCQADLATVIGVLAAAPPECGPEASALDPLALVGSDHRLWEAVFRQTVLRLRETVTHWEIAGDAALPGADAALEAARDAARGVHRFARLGVSGLDAPGNADFCVASHPPARPAGRPVFVLLPRDPDPASLLRRLIAAAAAPSGAIFLIPVDADPLGGLLDSQGHPRAALLALRAANDALGGAAPRPGPRLFADPVREHTFEKSGRTVIALWSEGPEVVDHLDLGPQAKVYEPLGTAHAHPPGGPLRIGSTPLFLVDADVELLRLQRGVSFGDAATLPLRTAPVRRPLRFANPFSETIAGIRLRIDGPARWDVQPRQAEIAKLGPGQEFAPEFVFSLPPGETEGEREVTVDLAFTQAGRARAFRFPRALRVALEIEITVQSVPVPEAPNDRRVFVRVANRAGREIAALLRVRLPNEREQAEPLRLGPGGEKEFQYVVRDAHLIDPTLLRVEVLFDERSGGRPPLWKVFPL